MKIKSLTLQNFRGFLAPETIDLSGRNLLIYGENGAGKSSIFYALRGLFTQFATSSTAKRNLESEKNIFSGVAPPMVAVDFDDGQAAGVWDLQGHPATAQSYGPTPGYSERVARAALAKGCLDYRSLLDTNYRCATGDVNLFEIAVETLLADFRVANGSQWTTIGELWRRASASIPKRHRQASDGFAEIDAACASFNAAFGAALTTLQPKVAELLEALGQPGVVVHSFIFPSLSYNRERSVEKRNFAGRSLGIRISFNGAPIANPHLFLNESRLSALALAIYLAGRLVCVPTDDSYTERGDVPPYRLLVLDDVLIGLDHSNRLPLLNLLHTHFADWQIVLLTHDRVWFEMARFEIPDTGSWKCLEIFEGQEERTNEAGEVIVNDNGQSAMVAAPRIYADHYTSLNLPTSLLAQASRMLDRGYLPAAANYTRAAYEATLKTVCHKFGIHVLYKIDQALVKSSAFDDAINAWLDMKPDSKTEDLKKAMTSVKLYRKIVLNPYSHSLPWKLSKAELQGAIEAVNVLHALARARGSRTT